MWPGRKKIKLPSKTKINSSRQFAIFSICISGLCFLIIGCDATKLAELSKCDVIPPPSKVNMTDDGITRKIETNGIPDHAIGVFPIEDWHRPDPLAALDTTYEFPYAQENGTIESTTDTYEDYLLGTPIGVAVNGVVFDPQAAEWWNVPEHEWQKNPLVNKDMAILDLDCNDAHVQQNGKYHYHGIPRNLIDSLGGDILWEMEASTRPVLSSTTLLGWANDGAPIYGPVCYREPGEIPLNWWMPESGYELKGFTRHASAGEIPSVNDYQMGSFDEDYNFRGSGDLDKCNGHFSVLPDYPKGIYHYHITVKYPYIPRCKTIRE